jgi:hypothetical protein
MKTNYNLPVDAGNISIISEELVNKYGGLRKDSDADIYKVLEVNEGQTISVNIKDTWIGKVSTKVSVNKPGKYYLGDACYFMNLDKWGEFLNDTDCMNKMPKGNACMNTGGDGLFKVSVSVQ